MPLARMGRSKELDDILNTKVGMVEVWLMRVVVGVAKKYQRVVGGRGHWCLRKDCCFWAYKEGAG